MARFIGDSLGYYEHGMIFWLNIGFDGDITSQKCYLNGSSGDIVGISSDTVTNLYQQSAIVQEVGFKQQSSGGSIHGCVCFC